MLAQYVQDGRYIDYTPNADVAAGAVVVVGDLVGVAVRPIPANTAGVLAVQGIFEMPKTTGGGTAIAFGTTVYWDAGNSRATATSAGNKLLGKTAKAAVDGDATVRVRLSQ